VRSRRCRAIRRPAPPSYNLFSSTWVKTLCTRCRPEQLTEKLGAARQTRKSHHRHLEEGRGGRASPEVILYFKRRYESRNQMVQGKRLDRFHGAREGVAPPHFPGQATSSARAALRDTPAGGLNHDPIAVSTGSWFSARSRPRQNCIRSLATMIEPVKCLARLSSANR